MRPVWSLSYSVDWVLNNKNVLTRQWLWNTGCRQWRHFSGLHSQCLCCEQIFSLLASFSLRQAAKVNVGFVVKHMHNFLWGRLLRWLFHLVPKVCREAGNRTSFLPLFSWLRTNQECKQQELNVTVKANKLARNFFSFLLFSNWCTQHSWPQSVYLQAKYVVLTET